MEGTTSIIGTTGNALKSPWVDVIRTDVLYRYVNLAAGGSGSLAVTGAAAADIANVNAYPVTGVYNLGTQIPAGAASTTGTYNDNGFVRTFTLTAGYYLL